MGLGRADSGVVEQSRPPFTRAPDRRGNDFLAGLVLVLAVPVAAWWLIGDLSSNTIPGEASYVVRPPDLSSATQTAAGATAAAAVLLAAAALCRPGSRLRRDRRWLPVLLPLLAVGAAVGFGERVLTAGVGGANIGAGLYVSAAGPAVLFALAWVIGRAAWLLTGGRAHRDGPRD